MSPPHHTVYLIFSISDRQRAVKRDIFPFIATLTPNAFELGRCTAAGKLA